MPLVQIGHRHRADFETDLGNYGFSSFLRVIDAQPNLGFGQSPAMDEWAQCASCTFVDFLRSFPRGANEQHGRGLREIRTFFDELPQAIRAVVEGDLQLCHALAKELGASAVAQVLDSGMVPIEGLATIWALGGDPQPQISCAGAGDTVLLEPNGGGVERLLEQVVGAVRLGIRRVGIGFHRHASAMDHWADFVEHPGFDEQWPSLAARACSLGLDRLTFCMAFPPCASLKWRENEHLEQMAAKLDLHFRRTREDASLMCPENVSGYSLTHDIRASLEGCNVLAHNHGLKFDRLLFLF